MNLLISPDAPASFAFFADLVFQATVLLLLAWFLSLFLRRFSAASRHVLWALTAGALLLLPLLETSLPDWEVAVLPSGPAAAVQSDPPAVPDRAEVSAPVAAEGVPENPPAEIATQAAAAAVPAPPDSKGAAAAPSPAPQNGGFSGLVDWRAGVVVLWLTGGLVLLALVVGAHLRVAFLVRRMSRVSDGHPLDTQLAAAAETLGVARRPGLRLTAKNRIPFTCGLRRSTLVLPEAAENWAEERLRPVLLHELAHVKRRDCLTQFLAQVCAALYWFHPLAWLLKRRMRIEREKACDDLVLNAGVRPALYGETLLTVAANRETRSGAPYAALAMARRSSLEGRLLAIMDTTINRSALSRAALATGLVLCAAAAITVATVRLAATEATPVGAEPAGEEAAGEQVPQEFAVIEFSGSLEIRHETHGHLLDQWSIGEISMLSGERSSLSISTPANELSVDLQGTLNDELIEVAGEVRVMQSGGFDPELMDRFFERPKRSFVASFETTLRPGEEEQATDLGSDELGRSFLLKLTPVLVDREKSAYWLFHEVGRLVHSMNALKHADGSPSLFGRTTRSIDFDTAEDALKHAEALHVAAEGMASRERTERLVDLLGRLIESARAGEDEEAEELMEEIDRTGVALSEDFEGWAEAESERQSAENAAAVARERAWNMREAIARQEARDAAIAERQSAETAAAETDPTPDRKGDEAAESDVSDTESDATTAEEAQENEMVRVTVLGEVNRAGAYELEGGSTILDALGHAGGWTREANLRQVICLRDTEDTDQFWLNVDDMIRGRRAAWPLEDGDTIVLSESSD